MKIEIRSAQLKNVDEVSVGKVFKYANRYYLKVDSYQTGANAVSLDTFMAVWFENANVYEIPDESVTFIIADN